MNENFNIGWKIIFFISSENPLFDNVHVIYIQLTFIEPHYEVDWKDEQYILINTKK